MARQSITPHDGVTHQRMARKDTRQQQRSRHLETEQPVTSGKAQHKRHQRRHTAEQTTAQLILFQAREVHLETCQEHDVVDAHLTEKFERVVPFQQVEAVLTHEHTGQNHADEMRNAQPRKEHRRQQNDGEHKEEYPRVVGNGQ